MMKSKKVGICRRWVLDDGTLGRLSMTDGDLHTAIRSALRRLWNGSARRIFLEKVRFRIERNGREVWGVKCNICNKVMGMSEKSYGVKKDGTPTKKQKSVYDVDHLTGSPGFNSLDDVTAWTRNLFRGALQILCRECHSYKTTNPKCQ